MATYYQTSVYDGDGYYYAPYDQRYRAQQLRFLLADQTGNWRNAQPNYYDYYYPYDYYYYGGYWPAYDYYSYYYTYPWQSRRRASRRYRRYYSPYTTYSI